MTLNKCTPIIMDRFFDKNFKRCAVLSPKILKNYEK